MKWEAAGMSSTEGEYVEFIKVVLLDGPVEAWLCDVEKNMRFTLKKRLPECRNALKKSLTKRDKWIKEWPGQVRKKNQIPFMIIQSRSQLKVMH